VVPCEPAKKMFGADQVGAVEEEEVDSWQVLDIVKN